MLGEEPGHKPEQRKLSDTGAPDTAIADMVKQAVEAAFSANGFAFQTVGRGSGRGSMPGSSAEALRGALAATVRAEQAVDHACHFLEKAVSAFNHEAGVLRGARRALESACLETGAHRPEERRPRTPSPRRSRSPPPLLGYRSLPPARPAIKEELKEKEQSLRSQLQTRFVVKGRPRESQHRGSSSKQQSSSASWRHGR